METDEEQPEYWEPRTFEVGDKVMANVSPECDWGGHPESNAALMGRRHGDLSIRNGSSGVVRIVEPLEDCSEGHRFTVHMDSPDVNGSGDEIGCCITFAAIELVKI